MNSNLPIYPSPLSFEKIHAPRRLFSTIYNSQDSTTYNSQGSKLNVHLRINGYRSPIVFFFFFFRGKDFYLFIFGCVGSSFRARAFSSCGKQGPLFIAVRGPFTIAASVVAEHRLQTRRLSSCGSRA